MIAQRGGASAECEKGQHDAGRKTQTEQDKYKFVNWWL